MLAARRRLAALATLMLCGHASADVLSPVQQVASLAPGGGVRFSDTASGLRSVTPVVSVNAVGQGVMLWADSRASHARSDIYGSAFSTNAGNLVTLTNNSVPLVTSVSDEDAPKLNCQGTQCLVVFRTRGMHWVQRFDLSLNPIDAVPSVLGTCDAFCSPVSLSWEGSNWAVVWVSDGHAFFRRVSNAGVPLGVAIFLESPTDVVIGLPAIASSGTSTAVAMVTDGLELRLATLANKSATVTNRLYSNLAVQVGVVATGPTSFVVAFATYQTVPLTQLHAMAFDELAAPIISDTYLTQTTLGAKGSLAAVFVNGRVQISHFDVAGLPIVTSVDPLLGNQRDSSTPISSAAYSWPSLAALPSGDVLIASQRVSGRLVTPSLAIAADGGGWLEPEVGDWGASDQLFAAAAAKGTGWSLFVSELRDGGSQITSSTVTAAGAIGTTAPLSNAPGLSPLELAASSTAAGAHLVSAINEGSAQLWSDTAGDVRSLLGSSDICGTVGLVRSGNQALSMCCDSFACVVWAYTASAPDFSTPKSQQLTVTRQIAAIAASSSQWLFVEGAGLNATVRFSPTGVAAFEPSAGLSTPLAGYGHGFAAASDGRQFIVATQWQVGGVEKTDAVLVEPDGGSSGLLSLAARDPNDTLARANARPAAAWDGTSYLVAYTSPVDAGIEVFYRRVFTDGSLGAEQSLFQGPGDLELLDLQVSTPGRSLAVASQFVPALSARRVVTRVIASVPADAFCLPGECQPGLQCNAGLCAGDAGVAMDAGVAGDAGAAGTGDAGAALDGGSAADGGALVAGLDGGAGHAAYGWQVGCGCSIGGELGLGLAALVLLRRRAVRHGPTLR